MAGVTKLDGALATLLPITFVAITVNVYAVPLAKRVKTKGLEVPVCVKLPGLEITVYLVITEPPSLSGAEKETVACLLPETAVTLVGASGAVANSFITTL